MDLRDAIIVLNLLDKIHVDKYIWKADVNDDKRVGIEEDLNIIR